MRRRYPHSGGELSTVGDLNLDYNRGPSSIITKAHIPDYNIGDLGQDQPSAFIVRRIIVWGILLILFYLFVRTSPSEHYGGSY